MIGLEVLIPLTSNAGESFLPAHHVAFEAFVVARFQGVTRLPGTTQGTWIDVGVTYQDAAYVYLVAVPSLTDGGKVGEVVAFAKAHYEQIAICIRYLGLVEIL